MLFWEDTTHRLSDFTVAHWIGLSYRYFGHVAFWEGFSLWMPGMAESSLHQSLLVVGVFPGCDAWGRKLGIHGGEGLVSLVFRPFRGDRPSKQ